MKILIGKIILKVYLLYRKYYEKYNICSMFNGSQKRDVYIDNLGNYVTPILTRLQNLTIEHGELYFYQQLFRLSLRMPHSQGR